MKKLMISAAMLAVLLPVSAQETYENAKIAQEDLNGTARYVGMGGAMEALGADISTINTNPAGIGLFRRSSISASFGLVSQGDVSNAVGGNKTNVSFDQIGFVYSARAGRSSFFNFAFNFHKSRNFNQILSAAAPLYNASLNKLTCDKGVNEMVYPHQEGVDFYKRNEAGTPIDYNYTPDFTRYPYTCCNQIDEMLANGYNYTVLGEWTFDNATAYKFDRATKGYIGEYDFNFSGNINNRVYLGLTVGIHDVHYKHYSEYYEDMDTPRPYGLTVTDNREITGTGFDIKAGIIFRPVEESPFRIGLSVSTPTYYDLRSSNYTQIIDTDGNAMDSRGLNDYNNGRTNYKFRMNTPWKFGASLGHTIGSEIALGLSYEYADYGAIDTRSIDGTYYDSWTGYYSTNTHSDKVMKQHTEKTLKGVHTLKAGVEFKPDKDLAIRLGYNYVSPMYQTDAVKDGTLESPGSYTASATDFTNWDATHRITAGLGYNIDHFNVSIAYQYNTTKGTFYPFLSYVDGDFPQYDNIVDGVEVSNKRHQVLLTLGYTF